MKANLERIEQAYRTVCRHYRNLADLLLISQQEADRHRSNGTPLVVVFDFPAATILELMEWTLH